MSKPPTPLEMARDSALDDDCSLDRALILLKRLHVFYGRDPATKKVLNELVDIQIKVQRRARQRHQAAERARILERDGDELAAQVM